MYINYSFIEWHTIQLPTYLKRNSKCKIYISEPVFKYKKEFQLHPLAYIFYSFSDSSFICSSSPIQNFNKFPLRYISTITIK